MSFKEYLTENENVIKLKELNDRLSIEKQRLEAAKKLPNYIKVHQGTEYWQHAITNTNKEIERLKMAMTKPKRSDSAAASLNIDKVENSDGYTNINYKDGTSESHSRKKDAIISLLNKGLSAADITKLGFSSLTVQNAKKSWKEYNISNQIYKHNEVRGIK